MPMTRISEPRHRLLLELARQAQPSMQEILDRAIEAYRRQCFLEEANRAFARLREDPKAWQEEQDERRTWDVTLSEGLDKE